MYFFNEKKLWKIRIILDIKSWLCKLLTTRNSSYQKKICSKFTHLHIHTYNVLNSRSSWSTMHNLGHSNVCILHRLHSGKTFYCLLSERRRKFSAYKVARANLIEWCLKILTLTKNSNIVQELKIKKVQSLKIKSSQNCTHKPVDLNLIFEKLSLKNQVGWTPDILEGT